MVLNKQDVKNKLQEKSFINLHFIKIKDGSIIPHQRLVLLTDVLAVLDDFTCVEKKTLRDLLEHYKWSDEYEVVRVLEKLLGLEKQEAEQP